MKIYVAMYDYPVQTGGGGISTATSVAALQTKHDVKVFYNYDALKVALGLEKPDMVHHMNVRGLVSIARMCREHNVTCITTLNNEITCINGTHMWFDKTRDTNKFARECRRCSFLRATYCNFFDWRFPLWRRLRNAATVIYRYFLNHKRGLEELKRIPAVVVIGECDRKLLHEFGVSRKIYVIPQPIQDDFFLQRLPGKNISGKKVFLLPKGATYSRGSHVILEAFSKIQRNDIQVIAINNKDGNQKELQELKEYFSHPNIKLIDQLPPEKMAELYTASYVTIFSDLTYSPFGRTWAESCARGTPVMAFRGRGAAEDYLIHKETGYFMQESIQGIIDAINELCDDTVLYAKIRANSFAYVNKNLKASHWLSKIEQVYGDVFSGNSY